MRQIDCHTHILAPGYLELFEEQGQQVSVRRDGEVWSIRYGDVYEYRIKEETYDLRAKLDEMDSLGTDFALLSSNIPGPELLRKNASAQGARLVNDYLAEQMAEHPTRLGGLACIPWIDVESSLAEIAHAFDVLGLSGVVLYSNLAGRAVDDPIFEPIYAELDRRQAALVLHPTVPTWGRAIADHSLVPMLGLQVDCSFALSRLVLGGVMERHPNISVVMPHAGGILPYMSGRIDHQSSALKRASPNIKHLPSEYLKRVYYDTVTPTSDTLSFVLQFAGPDNILFGTDAPWVKGDVILRLLDDLGLTDAEQAAVRGANAQRIFRLKS